MSYSPILKGMLHSCSLINLEDNYNGKKVRLFEGKTTDSFVEIHCVPSDTFVLDLDSAFNTEKLFQGKSGECKRADYILMLSKPPTRKQHLKIGQFSADLLASRSIL